MFATKTLAGRLLKAMFPWYLLLALSLTAVQLAIQYFSVSSAVATDLASLTRMLAPSVTNAVWELDGEQMKSITHGLRQNEKSSPGYASSIAPVPRWNARQHPGN